MPSSNLVKIADSKWRQETKHGRIIVALTESGVVFQEVSEVNGETIIHDQKVESAERLNDFVNGQKQLV